MKHPALFAAAMISFAIALVVLATPAPVSAEPISSELACAETPSGADRPVDDAILQTHSLCPNPNPGVDCSDYNTPFCLYAGDWDCFNGCCLPSPDSPGGLNCLPVCVMID